MANLLKAQPYLVLGTSTDVGKTFFVCEVCKYFKQRNLDISAVKPIISGFTDGDQENDAAKILRNLDLELNQKNIAEISPFRLRAPFSPLKAAVMENIVINFTDVIEFCKNKIKDNLGKTLLIEASGGVMTPINNQKTFLDLAQSLKIPVILIGGVYLGAISQILSAADVLQSRKIEIAAIFINDFGNKNSDLSVDDIISEVKNFTKTCVFS